MVYLAIDRELYEKEFTLDSGPDTVSVPGGSVAGVPWGVAGLRLLVTEGGEEGRCFLPCGEITGRRGRGGFTATM